jgi:hypothetical protein
MFVLVYGLEVGLRTESEHRQFVEVATCPVVHYSSHVATNDILSFVWQS